MHGAHGEINHWARLRCTLFPTEVPMMFSKNIKLCISVDGSLEVISTEYVQMELLEETPTPTPEIAVSSPNPNME